MSSSHLPHQHDHHHRHHSHHGHGHGHHPEDLHFGKAFAIGISLNLAFLLIEAWYGWKADSLALLADAGHNLSDVGGLILAWAAYGISKISPSKKHNYGWQKASIFASFANALLLLVAMGSLIWEAVLRLQSPGSTQTITVMVVAGIGILINGFTAWIFSKASQKDLNMRGAFLHMAADALVSLGVVLAGALVLWQGWSWVDSVVSVLIAVFIIASSWSLLKQSFHLLFDGVPDHIDYEIIQNKLTALPHVISVHNLKIWATSTSENALTAHLVTSPLVASDHLLAQATRMLHDEFDIEQVVLQHEGESFAKSCQLNKSHS